MHMSAGRAFVSKGWREVARVSGADEASLIDIPGTIKMVAGDDAIDFKKAREARKKQPHAGLARLRAARAAARLGPDTYGRGQLARRSLSPQKCWLEYFSRSPVPRHATPR